jgi:hypothetical protein
MRSDAASPDISSAYQKAHTFWQRDAAFTGGVASQPAQTPTRCSRPTVYRARRRRVLLGAVAAGEQLTERQLLEALLSLRRP